MGGEIHDARRTIPRAVLTAGAIMTVLYMVATLSILLAIPTEQVSGLQGIMQASNGWQPMPAWRGSRRSSRRW